MTAVQEHETELLRRWRCGDRSAGDELFSRYRGRLDAIAAAIARASGGNTDELKSEAYLAFSSRLRYVKAAKSGLNGSLFRWIRQDLKRFRNTDRVIPLPQRYAEDGNTNPQAEATKTAGGCDILDFTPSRRDDVHDVIKQDECLGWLNRMRKTFGERNGKIAWDYYTGRFTLLEIAKDHGLSESGVLWIIRGVRREMRCMWPAEVVS